MPRFQPVTVPVQVIRNPGDFTTPATTTLDPNPVFAELTPAGPPPRREVDAAEEAESRKPAAAPAAAGSPFPDPSAPRRRAAGSLIASPQRIRTIAGL